MNRWLSLSISALLFAAPASSVSGAGRPTSEPAPRPWDVLWTVDPPDGAPAGPQPRVTPKLLSLGRSLYQAQCASCHGDKGDARGPLAAKLRPVPTDFTRGVFKIRSTPTGSLPTDRDLFRTLTRGLHGTAMQPWRR